MTKEVIFATPTQPLSSVHRWMETWRIRHLPVLEKGKLVGILSDRDVLIQATLHGDKMLVPDMLVADAMTPSPITISLSTSVSKAADLMISHKIDALPVVDAQARLLGLVTSSDLLALLIGREAVLETDPLPFTFSLIDGLKAAVA